MTERRFAVHDFATNGARFAAYENLCDEYAVAKQQGAARIAELEALCNHRATEQLSN